MPTWVCSIAVYNILPIPEDEVKVFPDCAREPLCSNAVCDTSLTNKERAAALVSELSIKEKLDLLVDKSPGVPRLGIKPYFWWTEGLHGLAESPGADFEDDPSRKWSSATSFPSPILVGAAFDDALARKMTFLTSKETRAYNNAGRSGLDLWVSQRPQTGPGRHMDGRVVETTADEGTYLPSSHPTSTRSRTPGGAAARRRPERTPSTRRATCRPS